mmetsp:Transcript_7806/g.8953  ORF Transcript_7806/g.8953 Transcript_7806/m.8953 type:complete len:391 (+) Transcript_7806:162-1334(+)|eukprot:CAMPEP_0194181618 /NCGR_PEP_ID=MMETSP0154-20130528/20743_1 /TAXON_ID=1049557 /ORGANISM="Thalassiothrix antarctica, Strain L6-D1" /LENGTH=390 /DNA_ID=CAMNT_0038897645 /DNA_START=133 /DNA_END=1305 /DNA_ORIENTATION=-
MSRKKKERNNVVPKKSKGSPKKNNDSNNARKKDNSALVLDHLPPLPLVFAVLLCSGSMWVFGLRDTFATGKNILGQIDHDYLEFTKSLQWFDDSNGWRSTHGGLSTIKPVTTDENNMGGLFVRKLLGASAMGVHMHKLLPLLFYQTGSQWTSGHFRPLLITAVIANIALATLYGFYLEDFISANADGLPKIFLALLFVETVIITYYILRMRINKRRPAVAMPDGKTPSSVVSRILGRTVFTITGITVLVAGRDLFFPGFILKYFPRDDIYLEWTGVFLHSPPEGSEEAAKQGIDAVFYIGDKFMSQMLALNLLILALYKFVSCFAIKYGSDGSGLQKTKLIWTSSAIAEMLVFFIFRLFAQTARSASWDMRWHLMCLGYEALLLGLFAFT